MFSTVKIPLPACSCTFTKHGTVSYPILPGKCAIVYHSAGVEHTHAVDEACAYNFMHFSGRRVSERERKGQQCFERGDSFQPI